MTPTHRIARRLLLAVFCFQSALITNACQKSKDSRKSTQSAHAQTATDDTSPVKQQLAKNVILFIGDGMGVSTVTAARIFDGQSKGLKGEEHSLAFEDFDNVALVKTYNTNAQVPDSAGTATAIMSGYKTNIAVINVPAGLIDARSADVCNPAALPPTLTTIAKTAGKSVGIISTARITHATPAAMYGHVPLRSLEADKDIEGVFEGCPSLSAQLMQTNADIILGGGSKEFTDAQLETWKSTPGHHYIETQAQMNEASMTAKRANHQILGLFNKTHMSFEADRAETKEPSLAEMTAFAIEGLSARGSGYILMVEAGRVDHAHHGTNAYRAMRDMQALNEAVKVAKDKTGDDTLILVTADHSHVFTISGYPVRGNPILGLVQSFDPETGAPSEDYQLAEDGKPYTTLGYHNGPNVRTPDSPALTDNMVQAPDFRQQTAINLDSETHGGEDVPLYATGPGAQGVKGVMEQNEIHDVIIKALRIE